MIEQPAPVHSTSPPDAPTPSAEPTAAPASDPGSARSDRSWPAGLACVGAGALVAFSLPPWGWWPLAFVGLAIFSLMLANRSGRSRAARAWLFTAAWLAPGMGWMWFLSAPGYLVAVAVYAGYHALAVGTLVPPGRRRWLALPLAMTLAEALRFCFPFGGVPLASLAISQSPGGLVPIVRVGGALLLTWATVQLSCGFAALYEAVQLRRSHRSREARAQETIAATSLAAVLLLVLLAAVAPKGSPAPGANHLDVAYVQGGGPQGTHASETDAHEVFLRHLEATRTLQPGVDMVVWPENVVDVDTFATSAEKDQIAAEAARLDAPILVGVTEDVPGENAFLNAQVVVLPSGDVSSRYDKVRRVPFGEYMPLRSLLKSLGAPTDEVPRDAQAGSGPAVLDTPDGRMAVVISWEVFFGGRAREGVEHGGELLLNPTNGSSYTGTILQTQQVASSRLRAIETGRWEVQVSPTGFSAFVTPTGDVLKRSGVSEQRVEIHSVELRQGRTLYVRIGDKPYVALAALGALVLVVLTRRERRRAVAP
jgi:apolipoprotein N-acyltransferase